MFDIWTLMPADTDTPTVPPMPPAITAETAFSVVSAVTEVLSAAFVTAFSSI